MIPVITSDSLPPGAVLVMRPDALLRARSLLEPPDQTPFVDWKVSAREMTAGLARLTSSLHGMSLGLGALAAAAAPFSARARDLDWRINWYRDPSAAWWEQ